MAGKSLDKEVAEAIVIDWRLGKLSQRQIAEKYGVSNGVVAKKCKGIEQDCERLVDAGIQYKQELAKHDERIVSAVSKEVEERTKHITFFRNANLIVAQTVARKVQADGTTATYKDLSAAANAITKSQENILGKQPETVINNTNTQQVAIAIDRSPERVKAIREMLDAAL